MSGMLQRVMSSVKASGTEKVLPGLNLAGFASGNGSNSIPYKTEKALLPEPVFHPTTMSITPILNMHQVATTLDYRYLLLSMRSIMGLIRSREELDVVGCAVG